MHTHTHMNTHTHPHWSNCLFLNLTPGHVVAKELQERLLTDVSCDSLRIKPYPSTAAVEYSLTSSVVVQSDELSVLLMSESPS